MTLGSSLNIPILIYPTHLEFPGVQMIFCFPQIFLDDIFFFLFILDEKTLFQCRKFCIEIIFIPYTPNICQDSLSFLLKSSGLGLGTVKIIFLNKSFIILDTHYNTKRILSQKLVSICK